MHQRQRVRHRRPRLQGDEGPPRRAEEGQRAEAQARKDADAKALRPEMLLELADAMLAAKQAPQAAQIYDQLTNEKLLPARAEELLQRAATAYHLAGDLNNSEARIATFKQQFPNSSLLPLVLLGTPLLGSSLPQAATPSVKATAAASTGRNRC